MQVSQQREVLLAWFGIVGTARVTRDLRSLERATSGLATAISSDGPITQAEVEKLVALAASSYASTEPWEIESYSKMLRDRVQALLAVVGPCGE